MDKYNMDDFAKYIYDFADDMNCEFNLANDRWGTKILLETLILIASELREIRKTMEKKNEVS